MEIFLVLIGAVGALSGSALTGYVNAKADERRRTWVEGDRRLDRTDERERWRRQIRLDVYSGVLAEDHRLAAAVSDLAATKVESDLRADHLDGVLAALAALESAVGQVSLVGSQDTIDAADELRHALVEHIGLVDKHGASGEQPSDRLRVARFKFIGVARVELGLPTELTDPLVG